MELFGLVPAQRRSSPKQGNLILDHDVLFTIFQQLDPDSLWEASQVCRCWRAIGMMEQLWADSLEKCKKKDIYRSLELFQGDSRLAYAAYYRRNYRERQRRMWSQERQLHHHHNVQHHYSNPQQPRQYEHVAVDTQENVQSDVELTSLRQLTEKYSHRLLVFDRGMEIYTCSLDGSEHLRFQLQSKPKIHFWCPMGDLFLAADRDQQGRFKLILVNGHQEEPMIMSGGGLARTKRVFPGHVVHSHDSLELTYRGLQDSQCYRVPLENQSFVCAGRCLRTEPVAYEERAEYIRSCYTMDFGQIPFYCLWLPCSTRALLLVASRDNIVETSYQMKLMMLSMDADLKISVVSEIDHGQPYFFAPSPSCKYLAVRVGCPELEVKILVFSDSGKSVSELCSLTKRAGYNFVPDWLIYRNHEYVCFVDEREGDSDPPDSEKFQLVAVRVQGEKEANDDDNSPLSHGSSLAIDAFDDCMSRSVSGFSDRSNSQESYFGSVSFGSESSGSFHQRPRSVDPPKKLYLVNHLSAQTKFLLSPDGKYMAISGNSGLRILKMDYDKASACAGSQECLADMDRPEDFLCFEMHGRFEIEPLTTLDLLATSPSAFENYDHIYGSNSHNNGSMDGASSDPSMNIDSSDVSEFDAVRVERELDKVLAFFWSPDSKKLLCVILPGIWVVIHVDTRIAQAYCEVSLGCLSQIIPFFQQYAKGPGLFWSPSSDAFAFSEHSGRSIGVCHLLPDGETSAWEIPPKIIPKAAEFVCWCPT